MRRKQRTPVKERTENAHRLRSVITKPARPPETALREALTGDGQLARAGRGMIGELDRLDDTYGTRTQFAWVAPD